MSGWCIAYSTNTRYSAFRKRVVGRRRSRRLRRLLGVVDSRGAPSTLAVFPDSVSDSPSIRRIVLRPRIWVLHLGDQGRLGASVNVPCESSMTVWVIYLLILLYFDSNLDCQVIQIFASSLCVGGSTSHLWHCHESGKPIFISHKRPDMSLLSFMGGHRSHHQHGILQDQNEGEDEAFVGECQISEELEQLRMILRLPT